MGGTENERKCAAGFGFGGRGSRRAAESAEIRRSTLRAPRLCVRSMNEAECGRLKKAEGLASPTTSVSPDGVSVSSVVENCERFNHGRGGSGLRPARNEVGERRPSGLFNHRSSAFESGISRRAAESAEIRRSTLRTQRLCVRFMSEAECGRLKKAEGLASLNLSVSPDGVSVCSVVQSKRKEMNR